jgi:hypothetical protein
VVLVDVDVFVEQPTPGGRVLVAPARLGGGLGDMAVLRVLLDRPVGESTTWARGPRRSSIPTSSSSPSSSSSA